MNNDEIFYQKAKYVSSDVIDGKLLKIAGIDQQLSGHIWAKNSPWLPPITPKCRQKCDLGGKKLSLTIFVNREIKPVEVGFHMPPNFHIVTIPKTTFRRKCRIWKLTPQKHALLPHLQLHQVHTSQYEIQSPNNRWITPLIIVKSLEARRCPGGIFLNSEGSNNFPAFQVQIASNFSFDNPFDVIFVWPLLSSLES